jgi:heme-degrading monooxygenase HmoA
MAYISATRLRIRSWRYFLPFVWHAMLARRQAERAPGFLAGKVIRDAKGTYWTITAWIDQAAMEQYRNTDAHHRVMPRLAVWCDEAAVVHWSAASADLPTVQEAHRHMVAKGRFSKVRYPSLGHEVKRIDQPVAKGESDLKPMVKL